MHNYKLCINVYKHMANYRLGAPVWVHVDWVHQLGAYRLGARRLGAYQLGASRLGALKN